MAVAATTALVLLAVLIDSDVSRVDLPAIAGTAGTIALAVVTVRAAEHREREHQDRLPLADCRGRVSYLRFCAGAECGCRRPDLPVSGARRLR